MEINMSKKTAVMYGGGNIGRGFIGQLFYLSGYETVFIDVADWLVDSLNNQNGYNVVVLNGEDKTKQWVGNVRAVNGKSPDKAADEIAACEVMATAVGVNILPRIAPVLAKGIEKRLESRPDDKLNIIICENLIDADKFLREEVRKYLSPAAAQRLDDYVGFIEASVGRMVPVMTEEMRKDDPLSVWVEPFCTLPVDKSAFRGAIPDIANMQPRDNFGFYIRRKLFLHNLGHASCAYLGAEKGYDLICDAIADPDIVKTVRAAMYQSAAALHAEYMVPMNEIAEHAEDLISRFGNTGLGDTTERVGRDPLRKLMVEDRLLGSALLCIKHALPHDAIVMCIRSALRYSNSNDSSAVQMQEYIKADGIKVFLTDRCGLNEQSYPGSDLLLYEITSTEE